MFEYLNDAFGSVVDYETAIGQEGFIQAPIVALDHPVRDLMLVDPQSPNISREYNRYKAELNKLAAGPGGQRRETLVNLCTVDQTSFRIYISPENWLDSNAFQNRFATFMSSLQENHTVRLVFGASLDGWYFDIALGCLINSIVRCKAKVITSVVGQCGSPETYLWLFGKERTFSTYGAIRFSGVHNILKQFPAYETYFSYIFSKAVELDYLTEEQKKKLMESNDVIFYDFKTLPR